jgi:hypothetical protein
LLSLAESGRNAEFWTNMEHELEPKVAKLREQVERGEYPIDPDAVADALLKRLRLLSAVRRMIGRTQRHWPRAAQNECSYPESAGEAPVEPTNASPSPASTRPIHVIWPVWSSAANAVSIALRAGAGAQMQSS